VSLSTPQSLEAELLRLGLSYHKNNELEKAEACYKKILLENPLQADAWQLQGLIFLSKNQLAQAAEYINQAIRLKPTSAVYHNNLGCLEKTNGQLVSAVAYFKKATALNPDYLPAAINLGQTYQEIGKYKLADSIYKNILKKHPHQTEIQLGLAACKLAEGKHHEAMNIYQTILKYIPDDLNILASIANVYNQMGNLDKTKQLLETIIEQQENHPLANNNLGNIYLTLGDYKKAQQHFLVATTYNPRFLTAQLNLAAAYRALPDYPAAIKSLQFILDQDLGFFEPGSLPQNYLLTKALVSLALCYAAVCDWPALEKIKKDLHKPLNAAYNLPLPYYLDPFEAMNLDLPKELWLSCCLKNGAILETMAAKYLSPLKQGKAKKKKLKVGYLSADFGDHPIGLLLNNLLELHDKDNFEIHGLSLYQHQDPIATHLKNSCDFFHEIQTLSLQKKIAYIKNLDLHLIIDLSGHTRHNDPVLLASRLAPVQAHWLGFPASLGLKSIDFYLTTQEQAPESLASLFQERLVYLPQSLIGHAGFELPSKISLCRKELGLQEDALIFCCFSQAYRISKDSFDCWLKILVATPGSQLWLLSSNPLCDKNLMDYARAQGIEIQRLIFASNEKMTQRWRHCLADIWLDTFNQTSGTVAMLCIWAGLPLITLRGMTPQSRTAAAHLQAANLGELIADTIEEYIEKAIRLANDSQARQNLRKKILMSRQQMPLFKPQVFIKELEASFQLMWQQKHSKEKFLYTKIEGGTI